MNQDEVTETLDEVALLAAPVSHRLHPFTLILKFISLLPSVGFAAVALTWSSFGSGLGDKYLWLMPFIVPLIFAVPMFFSWLSWSRFSYLVGPEDIKIQSGVLARKNRAIPYERIQDVSIEQNILARILSLATVKIETGGSGGEEDTLATVSFSEGERLRDLIRDRRDGVVIDDPSAAHLLAIGETPTEEAAPIFAMNIKRILTAGLFNFSFILLALIGTVAQNLDFLLPGEIFDPRNWAGMWVDQDYVDNLSLGTQIFGVLGALISLIGIGVISGIITTFIREYGFRLDKIPDGFRRKRGLFTLTDMVMPIHRVQAAILRSGPIRSLFGWHHLKFQSLASDVSGDTDHSAAPCAKMFEIAPIFDETDIEMPTGDLQFNRVNPAHWWRSAIGFLLLLTVIGAGNGWFVHSAIYALPVLSLPIAVLLVLHWRHHQYAFSDKQLFVKTGWWRRKLTILPLRKVQSVDVGQSPLDHPLNLATVTIGVAGGSSVSPLKINDVSMEIALAIRARLLPVVTIG